MSPIQPSRRSALKAAETSLPSSATTGRLLTPDTRINTSPPVIIAGSRYRRHGVSGLGPSAHRNRRRLIRQERVEHPPASRVEVHRAPEIAFADSDGGPCLEDADRLRLRIRGRPDLDVRRDDHAAQ